LFGGNQFDRVKRAHGAALYRVFPARGGAGKTQKYDTGHAQGNTQTQGFHWVSLSRRSLPSMGLVFLFNSAPPLGGKLPGPPDGSDDPCKGPRRHGPEHHTGADRFAQGVDRFFPGCTQDRLMDNDRGKAGQNRWIIGGDQLFHDVKTKV
jgi:hypothetical protein